MGAGRSDLTHFRFRQRNARGLTPDTRPEDRPERIYTVPLGPAPDGGGGEVESAEYTDIYIRPHRAYTASMAQKGL